MTSRVRTCRLRQTGAVGSALLPIVSAMAAGQTDSTYRDHFRAARAAEQAHNDTAALAHVLRADAMLHGRADAVYEAARYEARLGRAPVAIGRLRVLAAAGLVYDADTDAAFAALRERSDLKAALVRLAANRGPKGGTGERVFTLPDTNFISEDITYDSSSRRFFVSSVAGRGIVVIRPDGSVATFVRPAQDPDVWGIFAIRADPKQHVLWATTAAFGGPVSAADSNRTALLRYDLTTGRLQKRYDLRKDGRPHTLGDMVLNARGEPVVSDGFGGGVYVARGGVDTLETLVPPGVFVSPQTATFASDGRLFVPDYPATIGIVDPRTRGISWLAHPDSVVLNGIDGLYLVGRTMVATQNGTDPNRVLRCRLNDALTAVVKCAEIERGTPRLGQPTHGVVVGRWFYYIVNSGWERFNDDGTFKAVPSPAPPGVVRVPLDE